MFDTALDAEEDHSREWCHKCSNDNHSSIIGCYDGVPIGGKILEDGNVLGVDEVDKLEVRHELSAKDVAVE